MFKTRHFIGQLVLTTMTKSVQIPSGRITFGHGSCGGGEEKKFRIKKVSAVAAV